MSAQMSISRWINRIDKHQRTFEEPVFRRVKGAADLATADTRNRNDTVYVMLVDETAEPGVPDGEHRQIALTGVATVLAIRNYRDARGEGALNELERGRAQVRGALLGWQPVGALAPVTFRRGQLVSYEARTLIWQDEYVVPTLIHAPDLPAELELHIREIRASAAPDIGPEHINDYEMVGGTA